MEPERVTWSQAGPRYLENYFAKGADISIYREVRRLRKNPGHWSAATWEVPMSIQNTRPNPYVGPRSFQKGEKLYGRDREIRELLDLLIAERIVVLYSPSGAGKSSLVQAGLVPELEREDFRVSPVLRVNHEPPVKLCDMAGFNRYVYSVLVSLNDALPPEAQAPKEVLACSTLVDYLAKRPKVEDQPEAEVILFDQFSATIDQPTCGQGGLLCPVGAPARPHALGLVCHPGLRRRPGPLCPPGADPLFEHLPPGPARPGGGQEGHPPAAL
jgi:hypothetical protein